MEGLNQPLYVPHSNRSTLMMKLCCPEKAIDHCCSGLLLQCEAGLRGREREREREKSEIRSIVSQITIAITLCYRAYTRITCKDSTPKESPMGKGPAL